jgi:predicted TIM-barrel fold metal-dependent hydrolase
MAEREEEAMPTEEILEPELPIVDPHHHLWDRRSFGGDPNGPVKHGFEYVGRMASRYMFEELLADAASGHNVIATVFVDCGAFYRADGPEAYKSVGETEFVNGVAARSASGVYGAFRACAGIVSNVNLEATGSGAAAALEAHIAAGNGRFRGIRNGAAADPDPEVLGPLNRDPRYKDSKTGLYGSTRFREGFATLAPLGLSFDAWLLEPQIPDVIDLARAFPNTPIVLDHIGTPLGIASYEGKRGERFDIWRDNIRALSKSENVMLKLGGLAMVFPGFDCFMAKPPQTSEQMAADWKPYIETCIEAFGADRCMFESNFPVDLCGATYPVLWNAFKRLAAGCSVDEKTALFSGSATKFYKLSL